MKKILVSLSAVLLFSAGLVQAAVPQGGYFLDKNGIPLTKEMQTPPSLKSNPILPQSGAVHDAMEALDHSSSTVIRLTVTEDGMPADAIVTQSAGSVILDEYAMQSINGWRFHPAKLGEKTIRSAVSLPVHFISMKAVTSAAPIDRPLKNASEEMQKAIERNNHPAISVSLYVTADGNIDGSPKAVQDENISDNDFKILSKYTEDSVKEWRFTPAVNPDGENIPQHIILTVQL